MSAAPRSRVVVLGASNVEVHFASLIAAVRATLPGPLDILAAAGAGRAYAVGSRFLWRGLPSICDCGLWATLEGKEALPTYALATDVGNDLAYGVPAARLAAAIGDCAERLCAQGARVVGSLFPRRSVETLPGWEFKLFRSLLFPGRRFPLDAILAEGRQVNTLLRQRLEGPCTLLSPAPDWYGPDRIHLRRRTRTDVWQALLAGWLPGPAGESRPAAGAELPAPRLPGLHPERSTLFGFDRITPQPSATLADGTTISLF